MKRILMTLIAVFVAGTGAAHEALSLEELTQVWGVDIDAMEVTVETVSPGIHVLFGAGGNVAVSIGDQGVLMVDSQFPQMIPKLQAAIRELGGGAIDFTINTHWHFDHADGNPTLGREGTWMVSHSNSRRMMTGTHPVDLVAAIYDQPPYPAEGLPVITYDDRMQLHFNGQKIDLMHLGAAHTTGDTAVFFRLSNVVHMGDVFNRGYPFVDVGNGGDLEGMISFCKDLLGELNEDTVVIPGHGPVGGVDDLAAYIAMLETVRDRISAMIDQGKTLEEVVAAKPTAEFDETYGDPGILVNRGYVSLAR